VRRPLPQDKPLVVGLPRPRIIQAIVVGQPQLHQRACGRFVLALLASACQGLPVVARGFVMGLGHPRLIPGLQQILDRLVL
jgi:hypothetical protein